MAVSGGRLYIGGTFKTANGVARSALSAVDVSGGLPTGSATVLSGPAVDGQSWQSRGLFVL